MNTVFAVDGEARAVINLSRDVIIVGGCGHFGVPLRPAFADRGLTVELYDVNKHAVERSIAVSRP